MHLTVLLLLLIAHVLADFYFQTRQMAAHKQTHLIGLLYHAAIYLGLTLLCTAGYLTIPMALSLAGLSLFHFFVDWMFRKKDFTRLLIDQALHIAAIVFVAHMFAETPGNTLHHWITHLGGYLTDMWAWVMGPRRLAVSLFLLFNIRPANILIVKLLDQCGLQDEESLPSHPNRGAVIGSLERILTFVLILCGEYLAGTLVVAIKSIGRIKKLDQPDFSDKFIIGSLFSLMLPVLSVIVIKALP